MPRIGGERADAVAWEWITGVINHPENLREGFQILQAEKNDGNGATQDRLSMLSHQIRKKKEQLDKLLELYLADEFPRAVIADRKLHIQKEIAALETEQSDLHDHANARSGGVAQLTQLETFCARIRQGLEHADFNAKRQILDLVNLQRKIALESGDKVLYLQCLIDPPEQQQRLPIQTSP